MASRIGGSRRKSRYKSKKEPTQRGKVTITKYLQKFEVGDKVYLDMEPAVQKGTYSLRFMGRTGVIKKQSGKCYAVAVKEGDKEKLLTVHPVHLRKV
jgi:large subunit ribosomal protein L21e